MADEAAVVEEGSSPAEGPLVAVSFQRNVRRKEKFLEAEPKALGVTQIGLSVFQITCVGVFMTEDLGVWGADVVFFVSSLLVIIAGSLAIAAQNLHLPTLRACLALQIFAGAASICNVIVSLIKLDYMAYHCWRYHHDEFNTTDAEICHQIESTHSHFYAEIMLIQAALFAISVTLFAYCCKVVNCCSPAPKMPVITVQVPTAQQ